MLRQKWTDCTVNFWRSPLGIMLNLTPLHQNFEASVNKSDAALPMPLRRVSALFCTQKLFFLPLRFTPCISLCCRNAEHCSKTQNSAFSVDFRIGVFTLVLRGWAVSEFLTRTSKFNMTPNGAFWRRRQFFDARITNVKTLNSPSVGLPIKRRCIFVNSIVLKLLLTCTLLKVLPSQSSRLKHYFFWRRGSQLPVQSVHRMVPSCSWFPIELCIASLALRQMFITWFKSLCRGIGLASIQRLNFLMSWCQPCTLWCFWKASSGLFFCWCTRMYK